ncbi:serine/threonine protein kinase [Comamonas composti]|uniref:serine/threonine protein kinase n=1 Tax=Comamonas composti TaxID=408558 RepID=UPI00047D4B12|nr:serine/threonine protein kinase [Comamonas composti]
MKTQHPKEHPFAALTPDCILDALSAVGLEPDGRLTALSSYENRVYLAHLDSDDRVVAKFYRPDRWSRAQLAEEHDFAQELADSEVPVVAPLTLQGSSVHEHAGFLFSVSPWRGGRRPELDDYEVLEWIGRFLARIHSVGSARPFGERPRLDLQSFGSEPMQWLLEQQLIPAEVRSTWQTECQKALDLIAEGTCQQSGLGLFNLNQAQHLRLHGDCHPGNVLWTPLDAEGRGGPHFVDLDDARMGPAVQDLWMLLSGDRAQRTQQLSALLEGYEQFRPFDRRELALIEPLRTLRLIHYSAWLARRWDDPIFAINFPWFGSPDYWRGQVAMLHEQIEAMQEAPLFV